MRSYTGAMRTNRPARHAHPTRRPTLAAMFALSTPLLALPTEANAATTSSTNTSGFSICSFIPGLRGM